MIEYLIWARYCILMNNNVNNYVLLTQQALIHVVSFSSFPLLFAATRWIGLSKCAGRYVVQSDVCDLVRHSFGPEIAQRTSCRFRECGNEPCGHNKTAPKQRQRARGRGMMGSKGGKKEKGERHRGGERSPSCIVTEKGRVREWSDGEGRWDEGKDLGSGKTWSR